LRELDNIAEIKKCVMVDGNLIIGKREFIVDLSTTKIEPVWMKRMFGFVPYFELKWNSLIPSQHVVRDTKVGNFIKRELVPIEHKFAKTELPEAVKELADWRFMKELKHYSGDEKKKINMGKWLLILGLVGVAVFAFLMFAPKGG
jgi:hypothetical protein